MGQTIFYRFDAKYNFMKPCGIRKIVSDDPVALNHSPIISC